MFSIGMLNQNAATAILGASRPYAVLILHMDGTDGASVFTDSSTYNHTMTKTGAPTTSSTLSRFGTTSLKNSGSSSVNSPTSALFDLSNKVPFCAEFWTYGYTALDHTFTTRNAAVYCPFEVRGTGTGTMYGFVGDATLTGWQTTGLGTGGTSIPAASWNHIAIVGDGTTIKLYLNGVQYGISSPHPSWPVGARTFYIGRDGDGFASGNSYIDEVCVSIGDPVYTANFTPPTLPFTT